MRSPPRRQRPPERNTHRSGRSAHGPIPAAGRIIGRARSPCVSIPASGCRANCETGLAAVLSSGRDPESRQAPGGEANHGRRGTHAVRRRFRRAAGRGGLVLAVRDRIAAQPDGARWRQCLQRHPVVLPGYAGMHRTLDLNPAPGRGRRGCPWAWRRRSLVIQATKPADPGHTDRAGRAGVHTGGRAG
jgi:hypothetical protein